MFKTQPLKSIYIHIPFCKSKCAYCNFISFDKKNDYQKIYLKALELEISNKLTTYSATNFNTVYIGGGTPSVIEEGFYEKLLNRIKSMINLPDSAEITIEINPGISSCDYLKNLKKIGFNRLSIGAQSFDNSILKTLNRSHTAQDILNTVKNAKEAGFENISIDLMYGLPEQSVCIWEETLYQAMRLDIQHISAYGLKIEENTPFFVNSPDNLPDEDEIVQMYLKTIEILGQNGFNHYEISNFAKKGFESQHNMAYWNNEEYFGFGLAAHGYVNGVRYSNSVNLDDYINNPLKPHEQKKISYTETVEEAIFLGLRLRKGINIQDFKEVYSFDIYANYEDIIKKYVSQGLMNFDNDVFRLTEQGILLSNNILADFLMKEK